MFDAMLKEPQVTRLIPDEHVSGSRRFALDIMNTVTRGGFVRLFAKVTENGRQLAQTYRDSKRPTTETAF